MSDLDCESQVLTLSWTASSNAEGYMTVVSNSNKQMLYNTTEPALRISTMECGLDHTLKVMSFNGTCVSQPTMLSVGQSKMLDASIFVLFLF